MTDRVVIATVPEPPDAKAAETVPQPVSVREDTWWRIAALAQRTCVPASEASRARGARAGLSDNG